MTNIFQFAEHHTRASAKALNPKTVGAASLPSAVSAAAKIRKFSEGMNPRSRQLLTAGEVTPAKAAAAALPPSASMTSSTELSMLLHSSQNVKMSMLHETAVESFVFVVPKKSMAESAKTLANRLKLTREALGLSAAELCKRIDITANRWSQYESGERRVTVPVAIAMCDEFGLTLDWIYRGDPQRLPHEVRIKMPRAA